MAPEANEDAAFDIIFEDESWRERISDLEALTMHCRQTISVTLPVGENQFDGAGAAILFTNDARLRDLNLRFRGKDKPTNVLSFPSEGISGFLGDIAIARETCEREAAALDIDLRAHTAHLIVHGLLHLIGYDHETDGDAALMEPLETKILLALGFPDPHAPD